MQLQNSVNLDAEYESLKIKITEIQQRKNLLEDSIRYLKSDYEKQIDQQQEEADYL
jgi:predicted  nucleic acid-binding Zn-ribbon protein